MRRAVRLRNRAEWLSARRCGSSTVASILGIGYRSPLDVYLEVVEGYREPEHDVQGRGRRWEPIVLHLYSEETGRQALAPTSPTVWIGPEEWATATPDAFAVDAAGRGLVEAKTDQHPDKWGEPCTVPAWDDSYAEIVRPDYAVQGYWQMWVVDAPWVDLAVLLPRYELRVFRLLRDLDYEADLVATVRDWWTTYIIGRTPPPVDDGERLRKWLGGRASTGVTRPATPELVRVALEHAECHKTIKALEQHRDLLGNALLAAIGDDRAIELPDGRTVRSERRDGRVTVDRDRLLADRPDLAPFVEQYIRRGEPYAYPKTYPAPKRRISA